MDNNLLIHLGNDYKMLNVFDFLLNDNSLKTFKRRELNMSIIDAFDNKSKPLNDLSAFYDEKGHFVDVCIVSFSIHSLKMF